MSYIFGGKNKDNDNTPIIIGAVALILICIIYCCCISFGGGGYYYYSTDNATHPSPSPANSLTTQPVTNAPVRTPITTAPVTNAPVTTPVTNAPITTAPVVSVNALKYGDKIRIKAIPTNSAWGGYLSPCGGVAGQGCGINATLRPDSEFTKYEPGSNLRDWIISSATGITTGTPVKYSDIVQLKATATRWSGADGYLSPCGGTAGQACGIIATLRPDSSFTQYEPNSHLRDWIISNPSSTSTDIIQYGETVRIKGTATRWSGSDGYLSPCGGGDICGIAVTLRPENTGYASYTSAGGDTSKLRDWVIEKAPETFEGNIGNIKQDYDYGYHNYLLTGNSFDGLIRDFDDEYVKWNLVYNN